MFKLSAIKKAVKILSLNETNALKRDDPNFLVIGVKDNNLVLRHHTYGDGQPLKMTVMCEGSENSDTPKRSSYFYTVSLRTLSRVLNGLTKIANNKEVLLKFPVSKNEKSPFLEIQAGDFLFPVPMLFLSDKDYVEYDGVFNTLSGAAQFKTKMTFDKKALDTVAKQDVRYYLTGVALDIIDYNNNKVAVNLISTDGHRMTVFEKQDLQFETSLSYLRQVKDKPLIITENAYLVVSSFTQGLVNFSITHIGAAYQGMLFVAENDGVKMEYYSKTLDGKYPDYNKVTAIQEPFYIDLDVSKIETMLRYQSLYLIGLENETYPSTTLDIKVEDGRASIVFMPKTSSRAANSKAPKKNRKHGELLEDENVQLDSISNPLFTHLTKVSPSYTFDCQAGVKRNFGIVLNNKYLKDALSLFVGCKKIRMVFGTLGLKADSDTCQGAIHFKNHTSTGYTGENDKITTLIMTLRI